MKTKVFLTALLVMTTVTACSRQGEMLGGQQDRHGCLSSAGYSWSALKNQCIRPFDEADIRFSDPDNDTLAVYVILSEDKRQAEVFAASLPPETVLDGVKEGYASKDGKIRLINGSKGWQLKK